MLALCYKRHPMEGSRYYNVDDYHKTYESLLLVDKIRVLSFLPPVDPLAFTDWRTVQPKTHLSHSTIFSPYLDYAVRKRRKRTILTTVSRSSKLVVAYSATIFFFIRISTSCVVPGRPQDT